MSCEWGVGKPSPLTPPIYGSHTVSDDAGATMVEYALMVALIAVIALGAVTALGLDITAVFSDPALVDAF
ncbi:MAG: Flp family type IVb pilin [Acidimicrobiia bacterium]|nr:Flp family type IVb pilin [Acidimicrobiia bacterium]NNF62690.1 Flp family type IVb pilin [Acidimicrobiia bacterium]